MNQKVFISLYLDTRRPKASGKYPLRLRVFSKEPRQQKLYTIPFEFSEKEFHSIWETTKPRQQYKDTRLELQEIENKANVVLKELDPFTFEGFERKLYRKPSEAQSVVWHYNQTIDRLKAEKRFGTASNYELSLKKLLAFKESISKSHSDQLNFYEITKEWLGHFEDFVVKKEKLSITTVGIYLRPLRAIFNGAIENGDLQRELYPFGRRKYKIPAKRSVKKALGMEDIAKLFHADPKSPEQEKARDFWFFSFASNGINMKDVALLKNENIKGDRLVFYRAKTQNTAKESLKPVEVILTEKPKAIIKKYGAVNGNPDAYLFPILTKEMNEEEQFKAIRSFTRFVNQHLKKLAISEGITEDISTYWARHSFATNAIRNGASMEFVSEALSHNSLKTTKTYMAGFEDSTKKEFMEKLLDF